MYFKCGQEKNQSERGLKKSQGQCKVESEQGQKTTRPLRTVHEYVWHNEQLSASSSG